MDFISSDYHIYNKQIQTDSDVVQKNLNAISIASDLYFRIIFHKYKYHNFPIVNSVPFYCSYFFLNVSVQSTAPLFNTAKRVLYLSQLSEIQFQFALPLHWYEKVLTYTTFPYHTLIM